MQIRTVETLLVSSLLRKPFVTALRTVHAVQSVIIKITTDDGLIGWGEAVPTHVITGDSIGSIRYVIDEVFAPLLIGQDIIQREVLYERIQQAIIGNTSAKAAVDMAVHDLFGQLCGLPLVQMLGGYHQSLKTDFTVSVGKPTEMAKEAAEHVAKGFDTLKVKVGTGNFQQERERIHAIRQTVGQGITIRLDANQGWKPKEAIRLIRQLEDDGVDLELIEQPVAAYDVEGLRDVTRQTSTPIMADESLFSAKDAKKLLGMRAVDVLNIKLMKSGGIREALKINALAEVNGIECMVGSMMETAIGVTAAAHIAASQPNITRVDLDAPLLLAGEFSAGGVRYHGSHMEFSKESGLGFDSKRMMQWVKEHACE
ncbi:mandelate racemase/muconate lactonizing enzyme family protein [Sporosarcina sp. P7]|uniref:mandelate racemase/muconate lactonizing enzyme family protein n=1 Tax=Sporosarcina sp. P7 TaxID=2048244 RepID=UPI000C16CA0C|nr:dipeptide epimerase [Sporosarcina sp. P7]PID26120.1 dipeptide epimerase [Sporosarcina sp. P7]